jgi:hypothetical protein
MNKALLESMLKTLLGMIIAKLSPEMLKGLLGTGLEIAKKKIKESETQWDDDIILPFMEVLYRTFCADEDDPPQIPYEPQ